LQKTVKALINVFKTLNYEAYYVGERCRNEIYNKLIKAKKVRNSLSTIATSATKEDIQRIFPNAIANDKNDMIFNIDFGNDNIIVESFHSQQYYISEEDTFLNIPITKQVDTLEEDFQRRVFTINGVAKNSDDENIFYLTAQEDLLNKTIKTINKAKEVFHEYPIRCFQAFALMSQTGFDIDKDTLKSIKSNIRYLRYMPSRQVGDELRKIMRGKNAYNTLKIMHTISIFNSKCLYNDVKKKILYSFHTSDISIFDIIDKFTVTKDNELELWSLLFDNAKTAYDELSKFDNAFTDTEINTVVWLMNNKHLLTIQEPIELRKSIFNSLHDIENREGIHYLKELIVHMNNIYMITSEDENKQENVDRILFNLCSRPYFINQITWNITDERRTQLLPKLIECTKYPILPTEIEKFMSEN